MKFAIATVAYHEERMIRPFVRHYRDLVDKILVLNSTVPWNGPLEGHDITGDLAKFEGAVVIRDHWKTEHAQRNCGLQQLSDFDWVFVLDPDEFFLREDFERLKLWLESEKRCAVQTKLITYWKQGYCLEPQDTHQPVVAVNPQRITFNDKRGIAQDVYPIPFQLHHLSWARTDEEVFRKVTHFGHAGEFNGVEWYEKVWLPWTPESRHLHPMTKDKWIKAIPTEVPEELKKVIDTLGGQGADHSLG